MIDLIPSDEQQQIVSTVNALLTAHAPVDRLRAAHGENPGVFWPALAEFGWFLLSQPEDVGGLQVGLVEEMLLCREAGRFLLPVSVIATTLAGAIAANCGDTELAQAIGSGKVRAGFLLPLVDGNRCLLVDAQEATHLVQLGKDKIELFRRSAVNDARAISAFDETTSIERGTLYDGPAIASGDELFARRAGVMLASALVGQAEALLDMAVDYAKIRTQFGKSIGAFQAIKHRCADMAVATATASAQVSLAALSEDEALPDTAFQTSAAVSSAIRAAHETANACIQIHGGMGFTWECHAQRYLKRAHVLAQILGGRGQSELRVLEPMPA